MRYSKETIEAIREDIKKGMDKDAIKEKYNCTEYVYFKAATPDTRELSEKEKKEVVKLYFEGKNKIELGNMFNTSYTMISNIIKYNNSESKRKNIISTERKVSTLSFYELKEIINEICNSSLTYDELAKKYNTTKNVIQNIATNNCNNPRRGNYIMTTKKKIPPRKEISSTKEDKQQPETKEHRETEKVKLDLKFNRYSASIPTFSCGLSYSSKQMPVKDYIFKDNIKNIFDFATLEQTIISFLNEHKVLVNGVVKQNLEVYNYGLPMCLTSLIKVCNENRINLTIYHYNQETYKYIPEIVFNQFGQSSNKFSGMFHQDQVNHDIYIQDKDDMDFDGRFYIVRYKKNTTIDGYIFKDLGDLFNHLKSINDETMKVSNKDFNVSIFVEEGHIENSKYVKDQVLYRIMNY